MYKNKLYSGSETIVQAEWWDSLWSGFNVFITFHLVCLSWIFFRARSFGDAYYILSNLFTGFNTEIPFSLIDLQQLIGKTLSLLDRGYLGLNWHEFTIALLSIAVLLLVELIERRKKLTQAIFSHPLIIRWGILYTLILSIILFGVFSHEEFIYFQF